MRQVLFYIPILNLPVYGYGMMLFAAFVGCSWLAARLARREGINPVRLQDLALWLFVGGILGARLFYVGENWDQGFKNDLTRIFALWDGGLIFYGGIFGGILAYFLFYWFVLRHDEVSNWKMADVVAPCVALGACLGRIGCLLTGCCFGNVACTNCPAIQFPVPNGPNLMQIQKGFLTPLGFLVDTTGKIEAIEAHSPALNAGLQIGDEILAFNDYKIKTPNDLNYALAMAWPRGQRDIVLRVLHPNGNEESLTPFQTWSLPVHPTQIYESITMALMLFFLLSFYPYKRFDGELMVFMMVGYAIHRFLNEMLRTDNRIFAFDMTISQNISILVLSAGLLLAFFVYRRPRISHQDEPGVSTPG